MKQEFSTEVLQAEFKNTLRLYTMAKLVGWKYDLKDRNHKITSTDAQKPLIKFNIPSC